ncbi:TPA: delta-60 repeat domain-containing protein [Pseudomonas putida]|nr:delta-60 repeat domain-containing protein [Pseudomonas putida]HEK1011814.1 delta-60 repeat domain-containing protein [Pseudomonas putida]
MEEIHFQFSYVSQIRMLNDVRSCTIDRAFGKEGKVEIEFPGGVASGVHGLAVNGSRLVVLAQYREGGLPYVALAGLTADGQPDASFGERGFVMASFGPGVSAMPVEVIACAEDGFLVLAEDRSHDVNRPLLARFKSDGTLDTRFGDGGMVRLELMGPTAYDEPYGLIQQQNGKILIAVTRFDDEAQSCGLLVRLTACGSLDGSFHDGGVWQLPLCDEPNVWLEGVTELGDGRIVAWGATDGEGLLLRMGHDGQPDPVFGTAGIVRVTAPRGRNRVGVEFYDVIERQNGGLIVSGSTDRLPYAAVIGHMTADGRLDPAFNGGDVTVTPISRYGSRWVHCQPGPEGKSVAAGLTGIPYNGQETEFLVGRFGTDGVLDPQFGEGSGIRRTDIEPGADVARCALAPDPQRLILGGTANLNQGVGKSYLVCYFI